MGKLAYGPSPLCGKPNVATQQAVPSQERWTSLRASPSRLRSTEKKMLKKHGVFDAIREKMCWFRAGSKKPEAGQIIWYQHGGARPHTATANERHWARHGKKKGFGIRVVTQPAQSPDLNVNDMAFFQPAIRHRVGRKGRCEGSLRSSDDVLAGIST